jgi:hypothetical protein
MSLRESDPTAESRNTLSVDNPAIIVYGNCQADFLADMLRRVPAVAANYDVIMIRNLPDLEGLQKQLTQNLARRAAVVLEQTGNFGNDGTLRVGGQLNLDIPSSCRRIRFPPLFMTTLWPFVALDARNAPTMLPAHMEGAYPNFLANRLILQLLADGHPSETVYERFRAIRIGDVVDLDRLHRLTMSKIRKLDQDADLPMAALIEAGFTRERLFTMQLHPSGTLCAHLARSVLGALGVATDAPRLERLLHAIARWPGIGGYDAPIHPEIVEHFGLEWADGLTYRYFEEGFFDFETCMRRYIAFEHVPEFRFAAELERTGDLVNAEAALRRGIDLHRKLPYLHLRLGLLLERQGRLREAAVALTHAARLCHGGAVFHRHLARVLRRTGVLPMAYASARTAVALDGDRLESMVELAEIADALGHAEEAADARRQADELRACFGDPPLDLEARF